MQNQPKTVETSKHRNLTTRVGLKSQKEDFDNTRTNHQTNIHQNMMNARQNGDIAAKFSIKTPSFMKCKQKSAFSEHDLSSSERIEEQLENTLNAILGKNECFNSNSSGYLTPILVDRIHARPGLKSQILELKAFNRLQNLDPSRKSIETQQEFLSLSYNYSPQASEMHNLAEASSRGDGIKSITEDFNAESLFEELKLCPNSLLENSRLEDLDQDRAWAQFKRLLLWDCNANKLTVKCLQSYELLKAYSTTGYSVN